MGRALPQSIEFIQRLSTSPTLYSRSPDRRIGPDVSLPVLRSASPGDAPQLQRQPEPQTGPSPLDPLQQMLAAWQPKADEPMILPPPPLQTASAQTQARHKTEPKRAIQRKIEEPEPPPLPLVRPPEPQPTPAQAIQRDMAVPEITPIDDAVSTQGEVVQRAEAEGESSPAEGLDLASLAQQIYPLVKRMLTIERERRPIR
jgi:hypothetical protein